MNKHITLRVGLLSWFITHKDICKEPKTYTSSVQAEGSIPEGVGGMWGMSNQNTFPWLLKRQIKGWALSLLLVWMKWVTHIQRSAVFLHVIRHIDSSRAAATICLPFYLSAVSIFSPRSGSLIEVRHLSHSELRARQAVEELPQASSKSTDSAVTQSALVALRCHFLREANHYKKTQLEPK